MPLSTTHPADQEYADHLERSKRMWNRWSNHYALSEADFAPIREAAIEDLDLEDGMVVLEIGCGPGVNFEPLVDAVGPDGQVVAVDYSPEMIERARARIDEHGWENVEVHRADATTVAFDRQFDAAIATLSLSLMPDIDRAAENVRSMLRPGGTFAVVDLRPVPSGPLRVFNPLLWRFLYWYANWNPDGDVIASLSRTFDRVDIVDTYFLGTTFTAMATLEETTED